MLDSLALMQLLQRYLWGQRWHRLNAEAGNKVTQDPAHYTLAPLQTNIDASKDLNDRSGTYKGICHAELEDDLGCWARRGRAEKDVSQLLLFHKASRTPVLVHGTTY